MIKRRIFYAVSFLSIFYIAVLYDEYKLYLLSGVMFIFAVLMWIMVMIQRRFLDMDISIKEKNILHGEILELEITADNSFFMPVFKTEVVLRAKYSNYPEESLHTLSFGVPVCNEYRTSNIISTLIMPKHCGIISLSVESIKLYDYINLFSVNKKSDRKEEVTIMPVLVEPEEDIKKRENLNYTDNDNFSETKPGDDPSEIFNLREYEDGDSMNRIHWKLSSRNEAMIVKEYGLAINRAEVVLIELMSGATEEAKDNMDRLYEAVLAIGRNMAEREKKYIIAYFDIRNTTMVCNEISSLCSLEQEMEKILGMSTYDHPYASDLFWKTPVAENARVHYIRCKTENESTVNKGKLTTSEDGSVIIAGEMSTQEIVNEFCLTT